MLGMQRLNGDNDKCPPQEQISPRTGMTLTPCGLNGQGLPRSILFGGASPEEGMSHDVFELSFDLKGHRPTWNKKQQRTLSWPQARYDHFAATVALDEDVTPQPRLLLFGGAADDGSCLNDTWIYLPDKEQWTQLSTSGIIPRPRTARGCGAILANPARLLIWGGGANGSHAIHDDAIHVLHLTEKKWTTHKSPSAKHPRPRLGQFMVAVDARRIIMVGGMDKSTTFPELWELDVETWQWNLGAERPEFGIAGHSMTLLPESAKGAPKLVISGGMGADQTVRSAWMLVSLDTFGVHSLKPAEDPHAARLDHAMVSHCHNGQPGCLIFGGMNHRGIYQDLYFVPIL